MKTISKSFFLTLLLVQNYIYAQNAVDVNPQGQNAIVDVKGFGQNLVSDIGRAGANIQTGTVSSSSNMVGLISKAGNSSLINYGFVGIADGRNNQRNIGGYGLSDGIVSVRATGLLGRANQKGGDAYGVEGLAFLDDLNISNKKGIGGSFSSTTTSNTPNSIQSIGAEGISDGAGSVNERIGVRGFATGIANNSATGVFGEVLLQNGLGTAVQGYTYANTPSSDIGIGGNFSTFSTENTNGNATLYGTATSVSGEGSVLNRIGLSMSVSGNSNQSYGIRAVVTNNLSNSSTNYGAHIKVMGASLANKYGLFVETEGGGNLYGAYIKEKTGIGVIQPVEKLEIDGRIRLRHNGTNAGLLLSNSINNLSEAQTTFVGLENSTAGSERFGVRINNDWKLLVGSTGITVPGSINIGSGTLSKHIRIETSMAGTYPANNFITHSFTATGAAVGDNVILNFTADIGPLIVSQVWVSAANTISVKLYNPTASSNAFPTSLPVNVILTR